jgi:hypothetical protein
MRDVDPQRRRVLDFGIESIGKMDFLAGYLVKKMNFGNYWASYHITSVYTLLHIFIFSDVPRRGVTPYTNPRAETSWSFDRSSLPVGQFD